MGLIKRLLNNIRNVLIFRIRYPWVKHGRNMNCKWRVSFWSAHKHIVFGDGVSIGSGCIFQTDVEMGDYSRMANYCAFLGRDGHRYDIVGKRIWDSGRGDKYKIVIEDGVWIGHGVIIVSNVTVGRGSIIAAGSVVSNDVPRYAIVAGVPAKVVKMRFTPEQIVEHERILFGQGQEQ